MEANTGIQVLISSYNCEQYLESCFDSIEAALSGYKWMMVFCDDASTDNTEEIINNYSLSSDTNCMAVVYQKFEKASTIGIAKNNFKFFEKKIDIIKKKSFWPIKKIGGNTSTTSMTRRIVCINIICLMLMSLMRVELPSTLSLPERKLVCVTLLHLIWKHGFQH